MFFRARPEIKPEPEDVSDEVESTILFRERDRETNTEGAFKRVRGKVINQSGHTITLLPKGSKSTIVFSKKDVVANRSSQTTQNSPSTSKVPKQNKKANDEKLKPNQKESRKKMFRRT